MNVDQSEHNAVVGDLVPAKKSGHTLNVMFGNDAVHLSINCHEPNGAQCRVVCPVGCENYSYPDHKHGLDITDYCNAVEFLDAGDMECQCLLNEGFPLYDGMSVEIEWNGEAYYWYPTEDSTPSGPSSDSHTES